MGNMFDAIVVGGGPAGAIAAIVMARAGARVLVLDRARFPREKLCGDTLNPGALAILTRLGLDSVASRGLPIAGMIVTGEYGVRVEGRYGQGVEGRALTRLELDAALLSAAAASGARVEEGVLVKAPIVEEAGGRAVVRGVALAESNGRTTRVTAGIVIGADGRRSRLARALSLHAPAAHPRRWAVGAYFQDVSGVGNCGEMHVRRGRYIGVAPVPNGLTNACVVTADRRLLRDSRSLLLGAVRTDRELADRFARARMIAPPAVLGPLAVECAMPGAPGLLLAGDAAGFIDPMTGDGLRFAMRGAELAAEHALLALEHGGDAFRSLQVARAREFSRKWRFNRTLRILVASPSAVSAAGFGAALAPRILRGIIRYAGDVAA
jgi:flavin-dependent dehydrogenase